jgi:hypothetical protein
VFGVQRHELGRVQDDALPPMGAAGTTGGTGVRVDALVVPVLIALSAGLRRRVLLSMGGCLMDNRPSGRP